MRVLDRLAVHDLLDADELISAVGTAMVELSQGRASLPPRIAARVEGAGLLATMPAYSPSLGVLAAKLAPALPRAELAEQRTEFAETVANVEVVDLPEPGYADREHPAWPGVGEAERA